MSWGAVDDIIPGAPREASRENAPRSNWIAKSTLFRSQEGTEHKPFEIDDRSLIINFDKCYLLHCQKYTLNHRIHAVGLALLYSC